PQEFEPAYARQAVVYDHEVVVRVALYLLERDRAVRVGRDAPALVPQRLLDDVRDERVVLDVEYAHHSSLPRGVAFAEHQAAPARLSGRAKREQTPVASVQHRVETLPRQP